MIANAVINALVNFYERELKLHEGKPWAERFLRQVIEDLKATTTGYDDEEIETATIREQLEQAMVNDPVCQLINKVATANTPEEVARLLKLARDLLHSLPHLEREMVLEAIDALTAEKPTKLQ